MRGTMKRFFEAFLLIIMVLTVLASARPVLPTLTSKGMAFKALVIYSKYVNGKVMHQLKLMNTINPYTIDQIAAKYGFTNYKVIRLYKITDDILGASPAWQVSSVNATGAWKTLDEHNINVDMKVAVIDTGVDPLLFNGRAVSFIDSSEAYASHALVDTLSEYGMCNDTGTIYINNLETFDLEMYYLFNDFVPIYLNGYYYYCVVSTPVNVVSNTPIKP